MRDSMKETDLGLRSLNTDKPIPSASGIMDVEGNDSSHPENRQDSKSTLELQSVPTDTLLFKKQQIQNAIEVLKKEYVGIDKQIDSIMSHVRTWYLFSELQSHPIVINLYGMTGVGKTSLVKRIFSLLDRKEDIVEINFSGVSEFSTFSLLSQLNDNRYIDASSRIFILDEFQNASTINENTQERDNRGMLSSIWELLDTGKLKYFDDGWRLKSLTYVKIFLEKLESHKHMIIKDNQLINRDDFAAYLNPCNNKPICNFLNCVCTKDSIRLNSLSSLREDNESDNFFTYNFYECILDFLRRNDPQKYCNYTEGTLIMEMKSYTIEDYIKLLNQITIASKTGYDLDFHDSIIFVIGNLDETFIMANDVHPDISADDMHEISKKISIVNVKKALLKRFRSEQIARLGNIHVIYPSFSRESYQRIIDLELDKYNDKLQEKIGIKFEYDKSIKDFIYKEGVFPTQGARPVMSTINTVIKNNLPTIYEFAIENNINYSSIKLSYKKRNIIVSYYDSNKDEISTLKLPYSGNLSTLRQSTRDDKQALTAVHESGHFIIYSLLTGKIPNKIIVKTANSDSDGFISVDNMTYGSYAELQSSIMTGIAGYVAEKMIFGHNMLTSGASSDLVKVTEIAIQMVREYGLAKNMSPVVSTEVPQYEYKLHDNTAMKDRMNKAITEIINEAERKVMSLLSVDSIKKAFMSSCKILMNTSELKTKQAQQIYNSIDENIREQYKIKTNYREIVSNFISQ